MNYFVLLYIVPTNAMPKINKLDVNKNITAASLQIRPALSLQADSPTASASRTVTSLETSGGSKGGRRGHALPSKTEWNFLTDYVQKSHKML